MWSIFLKRKIGGGFLIFGGDLDKFEGLKTFASGVGFDLSLFFLALRFSH